MLNWLLFMWLSRTFVFTYATSILMYNYKENRKRIIYPLKVLTRFLWKLYFISIALLSVFFLGNNMQFFLYLHFPNIFNFFFWIKIPVLVYIKGVLLAYFWSLSYRKRVGLYIFNYRRVVVYCHWWGKKILGFAKKQVLFKWIHLFLVCKQYWRNACLEKRRFFRSCYHFYIDEFIEIAFGFYFKLFFFKMARGAYYCYSRGNYLLKKVKHFMYIYCNYVLLKYSFINLRYRRLLLLICVRNYSFLRFFVHYPLKLHLYLCLFKKNSLFHLKKKLIINDCIINYYF